MKLLLLSLLFLSACTKSKAQGERVYYRVKTTSELATICKEIYSTGSTSAGLVLKNCDSGVDEIWNATNVQKVRM